LAPRLARKSGVKIVGVIPARYASSRFPGKPLVDICGKPMVWHVYQQAIKAKSLDEVYVAADDDRIIDVCKTLSMRAVKTAQTHLSGTDRVAEVAEKIDADLYAVIMGDEPLIKTKDVKYLINGMNDDDIAVGMLATRFKNPVDVVNTTTIKLAFNGKNEVIFMSRSPIPFPKAALDYPYYKNIGAYAFRKSALSVFKNSKPDNLETIEEIELLRLLEKRLLVKAFIIESDSISVDTPKDLERVRAIIAANSRLPVDRLI
jgi:3-deoxy-manno-octulosonate cytidylyltransferase (CMP-KDO synthetase)